MKNYIKLLKGLNITKNPNHYEKLQKIVKIEKNTKKYGYIKLLKNYDQN